MSWILPHAVTDTTRDHLLRWTSTATTAVLGRKNYVGFGGYWPTVAADDNAEPRDRAFAQWFDAVEKVVVSTTLQETPWSNSRRVPDPVQAVRQLRTEPGGDIIVLSSTSLIRALLAAGEIDRLTLNLAPTIVGGGVCLFDDVPSSSWTLTSADRSDTGALYLTYDAANPRTFEAD